MVTQRIVTFALIIAFLIGPSDGTCAPGTGNQLCSGNGVCLPAGPGRQTCLCIPKASDSSCDWSLCSTTDTANGVCGCYLGYSGATCQISSCDTTVPTCDGIP